MARPPSLPPAESFKHGTRSRYVTGCRCGRCKQANLNSYHAREALSRAAALELGERTETHCVGVSGAACPRSIKLRVSSAGNLCMLCRRLLVRNGLVPAKAARHHVLILSNAGVGYKQVADAASVSRTVLSKIVNGTRKTIRATTEKAILEVDRGAMADGALVDAGPVWKMIDKLIKQHGFTRGAIAQRLGCKKLALQIGKKQVTARTAFKVKKLHDDAEGVFLRR